MKTISAAAITLAITINIFCQSFSGNENNPAINTGNAENNFMQDNLLQNEHKFINKSELTGYNYSGNQLKIQNLKNYIQDTPPKKKKMWLGVLLSAVLPGAGEFYAESYLKAGIFFGVELLAWGTYTYFTLKGDKKTDDFEAFADANWSIRQYAQWLVDEWNATGVNPNNPNLEELRGQINAAEQEAGFSHTLPEIASQQYYELIGKYQPYVAGWKDAYIGGVWQITQANVQYFQTAMFKGYAVDRGKANDFYNYAKIGPITAILNHILSAADAAWTISTYNKKVKVETGLRMNNYISPFTLKYEMVPTFNMKVSF